MKAKYARDLRFGIEYARIIWRNADADWAKSYRWILALWPLDNPFPRCARIRRAAARTIDALNRA
jgi:hypothetical protein